MTRAPGECHGLRVAHVEVIMRSPIVEVNGGALCGTGGLSAGSRSQ